MPKKSRSGRSGAQYRTPRVQKNIELVRPVEEEQDGEVRKPTAVSGARTRATTLTRSGVQSKKVESATTGSTVTASTSGSACLVATRRQAPQKTQQRTAASLISAEHYSYVRKDLIFIAILAVVMFSLIIILHFVPGIGA